MASTACRPVSHSPITSISGSAYKNTRTASRPRGSSSTTSVVIFIESLSIHSRRPLERDRNGNAKSFPRLVDQFKLLSLTIKMSKPGAGVAETHPLFGRDVRIDARPAVLNVDDQPALVTAAGNPHPSPTRLQGDSVSHRILHQRLQQQVGDQGIQRLRCDVELDGQPVLEPRLLDFQIVLYELKLLLEGHFLYV